ncbi:MAG: nucleotidyltransferase [Chitinophagia bacterium]|nr:nucleotidyltransferase [Chitinophagia bacterium]
MARSIDTIYAQIIAAKEADSNLAGLTSTSATAIWRLWAYVTAVCTWTLENLFDSHKAEVTALIAAEKAHTARWYRYKALLFQYGDSLPDGSDVYNPIVPANQIVKQAAAVEVGGVVRIKAAKNVPLEALSSDELAALTVYLQRIKDAGVRLNVTSNDPDNLQVVMTVYYDPLVLRSTGERIDGSGDTNVKDAIVNYLLNLPFNGLVLTNSLLDAVRATEGVVNASITSTQARYGTLPYAAFTDEYNPDAGYITLDETHFLANIVYVAHGEV